MHSLLFALEMAERASFLLSRTLSQSLAAFSGSGCGVNDCMNFGDVSRLSILLEEGVGGDETEGKDLGKLHPLEEGREVLVLMGSIFVSIVPADNGT